MKRDFGFEASRNTNAVTAMLVIPISTLKSSEWIVIIIHVSSLFITSFDPLKGSISAGNDGSNENASSTVESSLNGTFTL